LNDSLNFERSKLAEIIENIPLAVSVSDNKGQFVLMNTNCLKLSGVDSKEDIYNSEKVLTDPFELLYLDGKPVPLEDWPISRALRGELVKDFEVIVHNKTNHLERILSYSTALIKNEFNQVAEIIFVTQDITERKQIEEKLLNTMRELERSNKELEQFAYIASHDLQSPVRQIRNFSQLLENKYKDRLGGEANEYLKYINSSAIRMSELIHGLLEFSRITSNTEDFSLVDCNYALSSALLSLDLIIKENNASVECTELPKVYGNSVLLTQLFQNLIHNAIKFKSSELPVVKINYEKKDGEIIFSVTDNGIGIQKEYYEKIFVIFQRLHDKQEYPGTGIGLAICKRIVEFHGGSIWLDSEVNKGTTFYFSLPVVKN